MNRPLDSGEVEQQSPCCDKCGAEITTGLMAAFCPKGKECEFWNPAVDEFMADFGLRRTIDTTNTPEDPKRE
jgi:hypothetical protein